MRRIMIIDSDIRQMQDLNEGLGGFYRILNCSRGSQAMELLRLYQPSALVLDPETPGLDGKAFIRRIRSLSSGAEMPILGLTRLTTLRQIEKSMDWGVDMILSKPCTAQRLMRKLEDRLGSAERVPIPEPAGPAAI
jgi:DNA-binding response OmpR family regulator